MKDRNTGASPATQSPKEPTARPARCRWLRWKSMYLDRPNDPDVPSMEDGFVWCVHTMNCLGPDGEVASRERCLSGRGCHLAPDRVPGAESHPGAESQRLRSLEEDLGGTRRDVGSRRASQERRVPDRLEQPC